MNSEAEIAVGDVVTFEWTDGTEKTGVVDSLWANVPDGSPSAGVSVIEADWENGRVYDIALEWVTNHVRDFAGEGFDFEFESTQDVLAGLKIDALVDDLTYANKLRASKPDKQSGLNQYLWRTARFHSGADPSMPVTATWWLDEYLEEQGIDARLSGVRTDEQRAAGDELKAALTAVVDEALIAMGYDPAGAAKRWKKAGAF